MFKRQEDQNPKDQYIRLFLVIAIGLLVVSGIHFFPILTGDPDPERLGDGLFNFGMAVGFYICSNLVKQGNRYVIALLIAMGVGSVAYAQSVDRGFNLIMILILGTFVWQMYNLYQKGELS